MHSTLTWLLAPRASVQDKLERGRWRVEFFWQGCFKIIIATAIQMPQLVGSAQQPFHPSFRERERESQKGIEDRGGLKRRPETIDVDLPLLQPHLL